ncbi:MAG TPA: hypothetical protein VFW25_03640 [Silvibacterium sp.]|nr:hypothetical protein [Silvibacterium sp.]
MLSNFPRAQKTHQSESTTHFVESLYSLYGPNGNPPDLSGANANQYFSPPLIQLAKSVLATAGPRYSGALDYNHLCNCRDTNVNFPNLRIVARSVTSDQAVATVTFDGKDGTRNRILIDLTLEASQWRISDIKDFTGPPPYTSLRALLKREIAGWSKVPPSR